MQEKLYSKPADTNKWALLEQYTAKTTAHNILRVKLHRMPHMDQMHQTLWEVDYHS
jgi:hypothetical protein